VGRRRTERFIVTKVTVTTATGNDDAVTASRMPDDLIVEEPMSIQLDGAPVATTMRTPGHDYELAAGLCFTDGLLAGEKVVGVRYCADGSALETGFNTVTVETGGRAPKPTPRLGNVSSSCGWCGSDQLEQMCDRFAPLPPTKNLTWAVLTSIAKRVGQAQELFEVTGAAHAAAAFDARGEILVVREDVGRHNAVDKVIGSMLLANDESLPATGLGLFVSGRASIEMVQKAWAAGFSHLVAVSAPTSLAAEAARRAGLVLAGFMRDGSCTLYAPERLNPEELGIVDS
jgi:FdhD protein